MKKLRLLLVDACVLIDFAKSDASVLTLVAHHVGEVHVATPVFQEVHDLDATMAASLGIRLFEPPLEMLSAAARAGGRLSFQDHLCVLAAKANGWTCVSNDRRLREECTAASVEVLWGLELLAVLVERRALSAKGAKEVAELIAATNKRIGKAVMQRFLAGLAKSGA